MVNLFFASSKSFFNFFSHVVCYTIKESIFCLPCLFFRFSNCNCNSSSFDVPAPWKSSLWNLSRDFYHSYHVSYSIVSYSAFPIVHHSHLPHIQSIFVSFLYLADFVIIKQLLQSLQI